MRVLQVIPAVAPRYGGPSQAIIGMCRALDARGCETAIVTTDADGGGRLPVELGRPVRHEGVRAIFFRRQGSERVKYSAALVGWLERHVIEFDAVAIHGVFSHPCLAAARVCRRRGIPYVVRPLGALDPWSLGRKRFRKLLLWHLAVKSMLRRAAAIHYTTADEQRLAEGALGLGPGVVIPLGVDEEPLEAAASSGMFRRRHPALAEDPYMLALSRLDPKKGLDALVEVFQEVTSREPFRRWRLVIAGDGEARYVRRLRRRAGARRGEARVLFTGWLDGADKAGALRGAALFALVSRQENFALGVVEAMACAVPVLVSSHVNLAREIQAAGAGWVVPLDPSALRDTLAAALGDGDERTRRGAAARRLVDRRFRWSSVAPQLEALYASVVAGRRARPAGR